MSVWYEVKVVATAVVMVEMETEDEAGAQNFAATEGPFQFGDDVETVGCTLVEPAKVESFKRHADEVLPL